MNEYNKRYQAVENYSVFLVDLICIGISYLIALNMRFDGIKGELIDNYVFIQMLFVMCLLYLLYSLGIDGRHHFFQRGCFRELLSVCKLNLFLFVLAACCIYIFRLELDYSRLVLGYFTVINAMVMYVARVILKWFVGKYYKRSKYSDKVLIVSQKNEIYNVLEHIKADTDWSYEIIGIALVDGEAGGELGGYPVVAGKGNIIDVCRQMAIDVVFFNYSSRDNDEQEVLLQSFLAMGIVCHYCINQLGLNGFKGIGGHFADFPVITYAISLFDYRKRMLKRIMDFMGGLIGSACVILLMPFIALAIKLDSPGPVIFKQTRIGKNGRKFQMYKFRSMCVDAENKKKELEQKNEVGGLMFKLEKDPRITRVGAFLRKTSLDEFPQFFNILKGDMSLVGTRPPTEDEFEKYNIYYRRRLSITPGLTGLWQVSGRSDVKEFDKVVELDLKYIDNWSLANDIKILIQTVGVVLFGKGAR